MLNDPLAEVVTLLQPTARFSKLVQCAGEWRVHRPGTGNPFYCAILEGACRATVDGQTFTLQAGDFLLIPAVRDLINESLCPPPDGVITHPVEVSPGCFRLGSQTALSQTRMRIWYCSFDSPDAKLLVSLLPQVIVARGEPRLGLLLQLINEETREQRPARELILQRLLEVMLIEALRSGVDTTSTTGLARGLADESLAGAIRAIHIQPEQSWTVERLAKIAALSRSAFFARFTRIMGVAPMAYLLVWRMALAKRSLRLHGPSIAQIAESVGYSSPSTFTVAFTRHVGMPPARYARMQQGARLPAHNPDEI